MKKPVTKQKLTTLALLAATPGLAVAGPQGANIVAGSATVSHSSTHGTVITQSSSKAVINWQSFSIGENEFVQFKQPDSNSISLNRVVGSDPSSILGNLSANGQVFLVNPNGIFFGAGATLDVGGLVASTLDIKNDDFLNGNYIFATPTNLTETSVVNAGVIQARESGYVVLMGSRVENSGEIETKFGQIALLSGGEVTLDISGDGLIGYSIDSATATKLAGVSNTGELVADGGRVILAGKVSDALVATAVNNSGLIQANGIEERNGEIYLTGNADVYNTGSLSASGKTGGNISIQGKRVAQQGNIQADASVGNGGKVSIKADEVIALTKASLTTANAGVDGQGGEVIVYTTGSAIFNYGAKIEAKGGRVSGDGGFVEVSGIEKIEINGAVDASATNGAAGTFLIDPTNITIVSADTADVDLTDPGSGNPRVFENDGNTNNEILDTTIETLLNGGTSVTLQTADTGNGDGVDVGNITVDAQLDKTAGGTATLTLQADNDIILNQDIVATTGALNVVLEADNNVTFNTGADITSNGGDVTITADMDASNSGETITMADGTVINAAAGKIALNADADITVGRLVTTDSSATSVQLNSVNGSILDAGDTGGADITSAGRLVIKSETGVAGIETDVESVDVTNDASGNIVITEANALTVERIIQSVDGDINISTTNGSITVNDGGGASDVIEAVGNGTIDLNAGGTGSDIILQDRIQSNSGTITLAAANSVDFQNNAKLTSTTANVSVTATAGTIVDNNGTSEDISSVNAVLAASTGVGSASDQIETNVNGLDVTSATGGVYIKENDDVTVLAASTTTSGNIDIAANGKITVSDGDDMTASTVIQAAGAGTINLDATSANDDDIDVRDGIQSASGSITLLANDSITFTNDGDITSTSGLLTVTADANGVTNGNDSDLITMASGSVFNTGSGAIDLNSDGDVALAQLTTTGTVNVDANNGAITDVNGATNNVTGSTVTLTSSDGIGATADALETAATALDLSVTNTGDINIDQTGGVDLAGIDTAAGNISVAASGAITTSAAVSATDGDVVLATSSNGNVTLSNTVSASSTNGNRSVSINATGDVVVNAAITSSVTGNGDASISVGSSGSEVASLTVGASGSLNVTEGGSGDSETLSIYAAGAVDTSNTTLDANDGITLSGASVNAAGLTASTGAINVVADTTSIVVGTLSADSNVTLNATTSLNTGDITVTNDDISLTAGTTLDLAELNSANNISLSAGGVVTSTAVNPYVAATSISLAGTGTGSSYNLTTNTAQLNLNGGLNSVTVDNTAFNGATAGIAFSNSGFGSVTLDTNVDTNVSGSLSATGSVDINGGNGALSLANSLSATNGITLTSTGTLSTNALSASNVAGATISLKGSSIAAGDLTTNATTGTVILDAPSSSAGAITANTLTVKDGVGSATDLTLTGALTIPNANIAVSGTLNLNNISANTGITLDANSITTGSLTTTTGAATVSADTGNITLAAVSADSISITNTGTSNGNITTAQLDADNGGITLNAAGDLVTANVNALLAAGATVSLTGDTVTTGNIATNASTGTVNVTANATSGTDTINVGNVIASTVSFDGFSITGNAITANSFSVKDGMASANDLTLNGNLISGTAVNLAVVNALDVQDVTASTGNVSLTSSNSTIDTGSITSTLGSVSANANGQLTYMGNIAAATGVSLMGNGISGSSNGNVTTTTGNVALTAATGNISVGNLTASATGASISVEATTGDASVGALNADMVSIIASSLTLNDTYTNGNFTATNTLTVNGTITNSNINLTAKDFLLGNTGILQDTGVGSVININASDSIVLDGTVNVALGTFNASITGASGAITGAGTSTASTVNLTAKGNIGTDAANPLTVNAATVNLSGSLSNSFLDLTASNSALNVNTAITNTLDVNAVNLNLSGSTVVTATDIDLTTSGNLSLGQSLNGATSVSLNVAGTASDGGNSVTTTTLNLAGNGSYGTTLAPFNSNATAIDIRNTVSSVVLDNAATTTTGLNFSGGGTHGTLDISAMSDVNLTAGTAVNVTALAIDTTGALDIAESITVTSPNALTLQANGIASNANTLTADAINLTGTGSSSLNIVTDAAAVNLGTGFGTVTLDTTATTLANVNLNATNYGNLSIASDGLNINGANINTGNIAINAGSGNITNNANLNASVAMGSATVSLDTSGQLVNNATIAVSDTSSSSSVVVGGITPVSAMSGMGQYRADTVTINATAPATINAVTNTGTLNVNGAANVTIDNNAFAGATTFTYGQTNYTTLDLKFGGTTNLNSGGDIVATTVSIDGQSDLTLNQGYSATTINLTAGGQVDASGVLTATTVNLAGNGAANFGSSAAKLKTNANTVDLATGINDVFVDNTMNTGSAAVNISGTNYGVVDIDFGGISSKVGTATTSTVQGNDFSASAFAVSGNGNINVTAGFNVNGGTVPGVAGDTLLTSSIASVAGLVNAGGTSDPNASFIATDAVTLNINNLSQSNQYLLVKADDITFTGTSNAANLLVQLTPFTISQTDMLGNTTFSSLSFNQTTPGTADFNYTFDKHFAPFTGTTIALGEQGFNGDISIGSVNAGTKNLLFLSGGTISGINNIIGTGLLGSANEVGGFFVVRPIVTTVTVDQLGSFGFRFGARVSTIELNENFGGTGENENNNSDLELEDGGVNDGSENQCS